MILSNKPSQNDFVKIFKIFKNFVRACVRALRMRVAHAVARARAAVGVGVGALSVGLMDRGVSE